MRLWALLALTASLAAEQRYEAVEPRMGTLARLVVYASSEEDAHRALRAGFARIDELNERLSDYLPESELNRIGAERKQVSDDLWRVLAFAQEVAQASGGAFDVTLGKRTRAWRAGRTPEGPSGWRLLRMDAALKQVWLLDAGVRLDLGGIAKGYAAQETLRTMRETGVARAMAALSGDIALGAPPPGQRGWRIQVSGGRVIELSHCGVSTSGDREQTRERGGIRESHIHDGRSGLPVHGYEQVTVVAKDAMTADALATAIRVLGREQGRELARRYGAGLYWVQ